VFYSVLGGLSGCCFQKTAPHFGSVVWSLRERERTARSVGGDTARRPLHVRFPRDSPDVATFSLRGPFTIVCSERLAHSRTTNRGIHLFPIDNCSLDTDRYLPPAPRWHVKKTPPPTELQICDNITTLLQLVLTNCPVLRPSTHQRFVPYGLRDSTALWFMCWFQCYINCLFVCLLNFLPHFLPSLLCYFLTLLFLLVYQNFKQPFFKHFVWNRRSWELCCCRFRAAFKTCVVSCMHKKLHAFNTRM